MSLQTGGDLDNRVIDGEESHLKPMLETHRIHVPLLMLVATGCLLASSCQPSQDALPQDPPGRTSSRKMIGKAHLPDLRHLAGYPVPELIVSPDCRHVAFVEPTLFFFVRVVVDGERHERYRSVSEGPLFSPDGERVAYVAKTHGGWTVVVDGEAGEVYDRAGSAVLEPLRPAKWSTVPDPPNYKLWNGDFIGLKFSPDSKHVAYIAQNTTGQCVVLDGREQKTYPAIITAPVFSSNGTRLAYGVKTSSGEAIVVDGAPEQEYNAVGTPTFSPDATRLAYAAKRGGKCFVVDNGQEQKHYDAGCNHITFSPDSRQLLYTASVWDEDIPASSRTLAHSKAVLVIDGKEDPPHSSIWNVRFSPDGRHLAYTVSDDQQKRVIIDGQAIDYPFSGSVFPVQFSPDGERYAVIGNTYGTNVTGWSLVIDGQECGRETAMGGGPVFSDNGSRVAYGLFEQENAHNIIVEQRTLWTAWNSGDLFMSPRGEYLAHVGIPPERQTVIINGIEGSHYHEIIGFRVAFDGDNKIRYLARMGKTLYAVEEDLRHLRTLTDMLEAPTSASIPALSPYIDPRDELSEQTLMQAYDAECRENGMKALTVRPAEWSIEDGISYSPPQFRGGMGTGYYSIEFMHRAGKDPSITYDFLRSEDPALRAWTAYLLINREEPLDEFTSQRIKTMAISDADPRVRYAVLTAFDDPWPHTEPHLDLQAEEALLFLHTTDELGFQLLAELIADGRSRIALTNSTGLPEICAPFVDGFSSTNPATRYAFYKAIDTMLGLTNLAERVLAKAWLKETSPSAAALAFCITADTEAIATAREAIIAAIQSNL